MRPELIVAEKEFRDHITSKRFIVIFGILLLLAIYAINLGMDSYNQQLDQYKNPQLSPDYQNRQQYIESQQKMLQDARDQNQSTEYIRTLNYQLDLLLNPRMPSVLQVFQIMMLLFTYIGIILGASLGFDQIARERDDGSLKFLVSSPVYRDAIINGKTIGAIATIACAMAAAFVITLAILLLKGAVPSAEDLARILLFFFASLLYCTFFFAIAMLVSALSKSTTIAAILTVGIVFIIFILTVATSFAAQTIAVGIVGNPPEISYAGLDRVTTNISFENTTLYSQQVDDFSETRRYNYRLESITTQISDTLGILSPINDFSCNFGYGHMGIGPALIMKQDINSYIYETVSGTASVGREMSLLDSLAIIWAKVLVILAETIGAFGIAYLVFMKADVR